MSPFSRPSRRKRGAVIAMLTASSILGGSDAVLAQGYPAAQPSQTAAGEQHRFFIRIAAGNLADTLSRFTTQTGIRIARDAVDLTGLQSPEVTGSMTAADALRALLAGSGLTYVFTSVNAVTLGKPPASTNGTMTLPPVQVQGQTQPRYSSPNADPYADPAAPYRADRLSSSKFTEPIVDTPRSVTVITEQAIDDKDATSMRDLARSTAGVTIGSGEGGFAFGDRFFIRGFDARNDIFVDGIRDPGVSIRDTYDIEQVEILRGPGSTFAGRGTTGGAINIVTKQALPNDFYTAELTAGLYNAGQRATFDINKALSPMWDVRVNGMIQGANVAGRDYTTDDRSGIAGNIVYKPTDNFAVTANYSNTWLYGLPDFGVPYNQVAKLPVTSGDVPRYTYYGIVNRDFTKTIQNIGTVDAVWKISDSITLENKVRQGFSLLAYIGTIPENPSATGATAPFSSTPTFFSGYVQLNAQSRYETVYVFGDQPQATFTFGGGRFKNTAIVGGDFGTEHISIDMLRLYVGTHDRTGRLYVDRRSDRERLRSAALPLWGGRRPSHRQSVALRGRHRCRVPHRHGAPRRPVHRQRRRARYDDYNITAANNTSSAFDHAGITSYNAGLVYKPAPIGSIYVAYATGADPVGDELDATQSAYGGFAPTQPAAQIFGPQLSRAFEVGTKWELFDRHLLATAAAFRTNVTNARETAPAGLPGYTSGQIVAGAAYRVNGVDFELAGNITDKWSVLGGVVLMNPVVTKSIVPTNIGLQLANIAPQSFSLLTKYELPHGVELGGQAVYTSQILGGTLLAANGGVAYPKPPNPTMLPAAWRFDAFAEAYLSKHVEMKLYVSNIFNQTYYDSLYQSAQPFIAVAPGRNISLIRGVQVPEG